MNKLFTKVVGLCLGLTMIAAVGAVVGSRVAAKDPVQVNAAPVAGTTDYKLSFSDFGITGNSYSNKSHTYGDGVTISLSGSKQTGTITDLIVTKGASPVVLKLPSNPGVKITSFTFSTRQWGSKTQKLTGYYSDDGGTNYTDSKTTASQGTLLSVTVPNDITANAIKIGFSSTSSQIGLDTLSVTYATLEEKTIDHISIKGTMSKTMYTDHDSWNTAGLSVIATYTDLTTNPITNDVEWEFDPPSPYVGCDSVEVKALYDEFSDYIEQDVVVTEYVPTYFEKVTTAPLDWTGEYLLVYENGSTAYVWTGVGGTNSFVTSNISENKIDKPNGSSSIQIETMTGGYSVKVLEGTNSNKYISGTSNNNALNFVATASLNAISLENDSAKIVSNTSVMRYNNAEDQQTFKYFKSSTYTNQQVVQLYKKVYTIANFVSDWNTATNAACSDPEADNTTAITAAWPGIKTNYLKLSAADQAKVAAGEDPTPASLIERYDHIVVRYALTNFMNRSVAPSTRINVFNTMNDNGSIAIIVIVSLLSVTAIGGYFFIRRRKEN